MGSYNFRLSLKGLILRQELFLVSILWVHYSVKHVFTVDSVPAVSRLWLAWFLVVSGLFLNILTNFLSSNSWGILPYLGNTVTHQNNLYLCAVVWTEDLGIFSCFGMAPATKLPNLCQSTLHIVERDFCSRVDNKAGAKSNVIHIARASGQTQTQAAGSLGQPMSQISNWQIKFLDLRWVPWTLLLIWVLVSPTNVVS